MRRYGLGTLGLLIVHADWAAAVMLIGWGCLTNCPQSRFQILERAVTTRWYFKNKVSETSGLGAVAVLTSIS
ncbi:hypothetical protein Ancab_033243 [Ancistrocladus abbreviatus]